MKSWTVGRLNWMDNNMFGSCPNLGINAVAKEDIVFFPNPSNSVVKIKGLAQSDVLRITDIFGRVIMEQPVNNHVQIDVSSYENGLYIFELKQQKLKSKILIK
jgi:hypothetical protein